MEENYWSIAQLIFRSLFVKFGENLTLSFFEILIFKISKFQKSELDKFIANFPLKHVITSTNIEPI